MPHNRSALVSLAVVTLIGAFGIAFVLSGGVRRLLRKRSQLDTTLKISRDTLLVYLDRLASAVIFFGGGYWFLAQLTSETAQLIALLFIFGGGVIRLVLHRWRRERQRRINMILKSVPPHKKLGA